MADGDNRIQLEVVTPKGRALSEKVDEVSLPGEAGEFGVLPGHLPALAAARTGIVSYRVGNDTKKCAIGSGFVEVSSDKVLVLTDELDIMVPAVPVEVVDTTGAGDAFNSGFAVALAEGRDIIDAVRFGVVCGGIACTKLGVVPSLPKREQADALFAEAIKTVWKDRP
jgi:ATP synthase F1 epsilon subunit